MLPDAIIQTEISYQSSQPPSLSSFKKKEIPNFQSFRHGQKSNENLKKKIKQMKSKSELQHRHKTQACNREKTKFKNAMEIPVALGKENREKQNL